MEDLVGERLKKLGKINHRHRNALTVYQLLLGVETEFGDFNEQDFQTLRSLVLEDIEDTQLVTEILSELHETFGIKPDQEGLRSSHFQQEFDSLRKRDKDARLLVYELYAIHRDSSIAEVKYTGKKGSADEKLETLKNLVVSEAETYNRSNEIIKKLQSLYLERSIPDDHQSSTYTSSTAN